MNKLISTKLAGNLRLGSLGLLAAFHFPVLLQVLPGDFRCLCKGNIGDLHRQQVSRLSQEHTVSSKV